MIQSQSHKAGRHLVVIGALAVALSGPAWADYTTTLNPTTHWGTWEGWGCSLAWWANSFGNRDDLADIVFTWSSINGEAMVASPNIPASARPPRRPRDVYEGRRAGETQRMSPCTTSLGETGDLLFGNGLALARENWIVAVL